MPSIRPFRTPTPSYRYRTASTLPAVPEATEQSAYNAGLGRAGLIHAVPETASRVLHIGCGSASASRLHPHFRTAAWQEVRVDVDAEVEPDIVASIVDLHGVVEDESCDAVWASHVIEHIDTHDVKRALGEIRRVLNPAGFVLLRCPDIEQVAQFIVEGRLNEVIYQSAAGPITPLDMLFGHSASIAQARDAMRHRTAFTEKILADALIEAGFSEVRTLRTAQYEIWAAAFREAAPVDVYVERLAECGTVLRQ